MLWTHYLGVFFNMLNVHFRRVTINMLNVHFLRSCKYLEVVVHSRWQS